MFVLNNPMSAQHTHSCTGSFLPLNPPSPSIIDESHRQCIHTLTHTLTHTHTHTHTHTYVTHTYVSHTHTCHTHIRVTHKYVSLTFRRCLRSAAHAASPGARFAVAEIAAGVSDGKVAAGHGWARKLKRCPARTL